MRGCLLPAQTAADFDPAGPADHPVEQNQIGRVFGGQQQRFITIIGGAHVIAFTAKPVFDQFRQRGVILDQKQLGRGHRMFPSTRGSAPRRPFADTSNVTVS